MPDDNYQKYFHFENDILYPTDAKGECQQSLGIMRFFKMTYDKADLKPLLERVEKEIVKHPHNAAALLDSAYLMFLQGTDASSKMKFIQGVNAYALERQYDAFAQTVFYKTLPSKSPKLRVLCLAAPGEVSNNTPIEFLLQNEEIDTTFWYVLPKSPDLKSIPEHDIAIVIASISDFTKPNTDAIQKIVHNWPKPVLNRIENLEKFSRDQFYKYGEGISGLYIPETKTVLRSAITLNAPPYPYPFIIRPLKSFGGRGLSKIEQGSDLTNYLNTHHGAEFYVYPFIDYSGEDGLFRKYRVAVIDGKAFPFHMAISEKWALWYYNSGMLSDKKKLAEEDNFLANFDKDGLGKKHGKAIEKLAKKVGSEYFVLDCAETKKGELLIFEGGHDMIIHDMDSAELFPIKRKQVERLFRAFQNMLKSHAETLVRK